VPIRRENGYVVVLAREAIFAGPTGLSRRTKKIPPNEREVKAKEPNVFIVRRRIDLFDAVKTNCARVSLQYCRTDLRMLNALIRKAFGQPVGLEQSSFHSPI